ncbi:MAG: metallopeptidase TldD-related protein [Thermoanaerobaculia bacterium]
MSGSGGFALDRLREELSAQSGDRWEIFAKRTVSREVRATPKLREESDRIEEGYAARWEAGGRSLFASASSAALLRAGISEATRIPAGTHDPLPPLPAGRFDGHAEPGAIADLDQFDALAQLLASESKGHARLTSLTAAAGFLLERLENGAGFEGTRSRPFGYGNARAVGVREDRRMSADVVFPLEAGPVFDLSRTAQSLADRCLIPLRGSASPFPRGELLLDPSVSALMLSATLPLFCGDEHRLLLSRKYLDRSGRFGAGGVSILDDATAESPFDGEGVPVRRTAVLDEGVFRRRLHDLGSAARAGEEPTGNAIRGSFRFPPRPGSARILLHSPTADSPAELLGRVTRGIYATATCAPIRVDLENDRYSLEVEGWALQAGRAKAPVRSASIRGRLSEFWKNLSGVGDDVRWFPLQSMTGAPTLLLPRVAFG